MICCSSVLSMVFSFTIISEEVIFKQGKIEQEKCCMQLEIPIFLMWSTSWSPFHVFLGNHTAGNGDAYLPAGAGHMSWSVCGRVLDIVILPHQKTRHVSSVAKMQALASRTRYAFGPVKEMCNSLLSSNQSMPNIWGRNIFGPVRCVVVESLWRKKGENCTAGVIGTGLSWFTPCSPVGEERGGLQGWCHLMSWTRLLEEISLWCALPAIQQPYSY